MCFLLSRYNNSTYFCRIKTKKYELNKFDDLWVSNTYYIHVNTSNETYYHRKLSMRVSNERESFETQRRSWDHLVLRIYYDKGFEQSGTISTKEFCLLLYLSTVYNIVLLLFWREMSVGRLQLQPAQKKKMKTLRIFVTEWDYRNNTMHEIRIVY